MEFPDDLKYTREHEWLLLEGNVATIGITAFAEQQLGDVVFVELPAVGDKVVKDEAMGVVESVKAVSDVIAPLSGEVLEVNQAVVDAPETINEDPYDGGWLVRIRLADPAEVDSLLDAEAYKRVLADQ